MKAKLKLKLWIGGGLLLLLLLFILLGPFLAGRPNAALYSTLPEQSSGLLERKVDQSPAVTPSPNSPSELRRIIRTAELYLEVRSWTVAQTRLTELARSYQGYISDSAVVRDASGARSGQLQLRLPSRSFDQALLEIEKLGRLTQQRSSGEDVTLEYTDLQSRLRNLNREEAQLLGILNRAQTVKDILEVERELARVRGEIETATGRINYLKHQTDLATITVYLSEQSLAPPTAFWNLGGTAQQAVRALGATIRFLVGLLIWVAIFLPLLGLGYLGYRFFKKVFPGNNRHPALE